MSPLDELTGMSPNRGDNKMSPLDEFTGKSPYRRDNKMSPTLLTVMYYTSSTRKNETR